METEPSIEQVGRHRIWLEEPHAVFMDLDGDLTAHDLSRLLPILDRVGGGVGPVIIVQDLSKVGSFTAGARKLIAEDPRTLRVARVICAGTSFQMRVIMTMVQKAAQIMGRRPALSLFVDDMVAARRTLALERENMKSWTTP